MRFFGEADPYEASRSLVDIGRDVALPVVARLGPTTERFAQRVLHVPVAGLEELARAVVARTASVGRPPEDRPFSGHITVARPIGRRRVDLRPFTGAPIEATWPVESVTLVSSRPGGASGSRYEVVEEVALRLSTP